MNNDNNRDKQTKKGETNNISDEKNSIPSKMLIVLFLFCVVGIAVRGE